MDSNTKLILIIIVFAVIIVLLFNPRLNKTCQSNKNENFDNSLDTIDPALNQWSKDIKYRPYSSNDTINDTATFKIKGQTYDQNKAMIQRLRDQYYDNKIANANINIEADNAMLLNTSKPPVRHVDIRTSMDDTNINKDRMIESNNIPRFCIYHGLIDTKNDNEQYSSNMIAMSAMTDFGDKSYCNENDIYPPCALNNSNCPLINRNKDTMNIGEPINEYVDVNDDYSDYDKEDKKGGTGYKKFK